MNLALLLPAGLAALAALLLPLSIHLARRSERRPTDFAALRWLHARVRPRHNLRLDEWWLLTLRLLLVAALALLLARPVMFGASDATPWIVAAPGVDAGVLRRSGTDESGARAERRWLAPGFPEADAPPPPFPATSVASLLRELDATLPSGAPLTVLVPPFLDGVDAERPVMSRAVHWRIVPGDLVAPVPPSVPAPGMPTLHVRHASDRAGGVRYLRAAAEAWAATSVDSGVGSGERTPPTALVVGNPDDPLPPGATALAWLVPGPLPASILGWIEGGGTALLDSQTEVAGMETKAIAQWRDQDGAVLVRGMPMGRGRVLQWTRPLAPAAMPALLDAGFPAQLRALFAPAMQAPGRVSSSAYSPRTGMAAWPERPKALSHWLVLLVAVLFLVERLVAANPRRRTAG
ncbi:BatA domain-containing protein [Luteimonas vadosa]|uniref:BatA domain-containing protein n=1 Tax=Luteimonas vadosa TaxID=1165507 RepID=A0ABP9E111_9GAMM